MVFLQGMVSDGWYIYTDHLLALNSCTSQPPPFLSLEVYTPLITDQWDQYLQSHPDEQFVSYILQGISSGFRIDFVQSHLVLPVSNNLPSSSNVAVIGEYLSSFIKNVEIRL